MDPTISAAIAGVQQLAKNELNKALSDERAFTYMVIKNYFVDAENTPMVDIDNMVTDGKNDGGIDFVCFNDEKPSVVVGQTKCSDNVAINDVINELHKMIGTIAAFRSGTSGYLNNRVQRELQESFDRLPDDSKGSIEYYFFTTSSLDERKLREKIQSSMPQFESEELFTFCQSDNIRSMVIANMEDPGTINEDYLEIDSKHNILEYEAPNGRRGMITNIKASSLVRLHRRYIDKGLLSLNIRGFIKNKSIDKEINDTLHKHRDDFWFYNNGITIACSDYWTDGNRVKLADFSIVNGGQTTSLIGQYSGSNSNEFFIPCKIVCPAENEDPQRFFSKIAEATNSQKPIKPRDLKSNSSEMQRLQKWLSQEKIFLEIKRGDKRRMKKDDYFLTNETWAQLMLSFVYQQPGTARSGKRNIWENAETYNKLFKQNYESDPNKKRFVVDLLQLWDRFTRIDKKFKSPESQLSPSEKESLKNGKLAILGLIGALYDIVNEDISIEDLRSDLSILETHTFTYGAFISNYRGDDIDEVLEALIYDLITQLDEAYSICSENGKCSSISNLLKTDKQYRNEVLVYMLKNLKRTPGESIVSGAKKLLMRS
jgi:hypothetical protein